MKFPKKVLEKLDVVLQQNEKRKQEAKERVLAVKKRNEDLEKLRQSKKSELLGYAKEVSYWLKDFYSSEDLKQIFSVLELQSDLRIFCDNFWQGFPKEKHSYCYATIIVNKNGIVSYCERYKGMPVHETKLGKIPLNPNRLVSKLHPDYLKNLAEHLRSGDVWNYIEQEVSVHIRLNNGF